MKYKLKYTRFNEHSILIEWPSIIDENTLNNVLNFKNLLLNNHIKVKVDVINTYNSILINYEITIEDIYSEFLYLKTLYFNSEEQSLVKSKIWEVPVCYDPSLGIDLEAAAKIANCNIEALIQEHTAHIYTVYCLGFLPGFAYMGDVPKKIQLPRHPQPRATVVAGSVGIAGKQTGIYPTDSPGGWQIIGRTPIKIFDTIKLSLFKAGDQVKFNPIDLALFHELNNQEDVH